MISINSNELVEYYLNSVSQILSPSLLEYVISDQAFVRNKIEQVLSQATLEEVLQSDETGKFDEVQINDIEVDEDAFLLQVENRVRSRIDEPAVEQYIGEQKRHKSAFLKEISEKGLSLRGTAEKIEKNNGNSDSRGTMMNY